MKNKDVHFADPIGERTDWQEQQEKLVRLLQGAELSHSDAGARANIELAKVLVLVGRELQRIADVMPEPSTAAQRSAVFAPSQEGD